MNRWMLRLAVTFVIALALSLPAAAQKPEITILVWSHFIPDVDKVLKQAAEYNDGPCVIEAEVVKEDNVFPMIPAGARYVLSVDCTLRHGSGCFANSCGIFTKADPVGLHRLAGVCDFFTMLVVDQYINTWRTVRIDHHIELGFWINSVDMTHVIVV